MEHRRKIQRISFHGEPDRLPTENGMGGNLSGIRQKLDYLKELGINGIYLNPIMKAESNHKYDTTDYEKIDPVFGDEKEFSLLAKEAHDHGIRVMVDAVFNHCGPKICSLAGRAGKGTGFRICRLVYDP